MLNAIHPSTKQYSSHQPYGSLGEKIMEYIHDKETRTRTQRFGPPNIPQEPRISKHEHMVAFLQGIFEDVWSSEKWLNLMHISLNVIHEVSNGLVSDRLPATTWTNDYKGAIQTTVGQHIYNTNSYM